jgi:nicotinate-nucleotide adenylyltransferase
MNVAFYGGSYDPPHVGHVLAAAYLTSVAGFDRVLVVPVFGHAFDKHLAAFEQRVRLCELAFARLADVEVSRIESELSAPSYTVATVKALLARNPSWRIRVVVGSDVLPEIERWHQLDELQRLAPLFVLARRGVEGCAGPVLLPEVSSTQIRELCKKDPSRSHDAELSLLLPSAVLEAIRRWGLYQST